MKNKLSNKCIFKGNVFFLFLLVGFISVLFGAVDDASLKGKSISELYALLGVSKDSSDQKTILSYINGKAIPKEERDFKLIEKNMSGSEVDRARALRWVQNINDKKLGEPLLEALKNQRKTYSSSISHQQLSEEEQKKIKNNKEQNIAILIEKLAELKIDKATPEIRQFTSNEYSTELQIEATNALAQLKDESFFGTTRVQKLRNFYIDKDSADTVPWLMSAMFNEPDLEDRVLAARAFAEIGNIDNMRDVEFAYKLANSTGSTYDSLNRQRYGVDFLSRRAIKYSEDKKLFESFSGWATLSFPGQTSSIGTLPFFAKIPQFHSQVISILNLTLKDKNLSIRYQAQVALFPVIGKLVHYDGEYSCSDHPKKQMTK